MWRHTDRHLSSARFEKGEIIKKKTLGGFVSLLGGCVHTLPTHISVQTTCKRACSIRWPLKGVVYPDSQYIKHKAKYS